MPSKHAHDASASAASPGHLYIVATPIGNLADITLRALEVLRAADRIVAEDTRHTRKLLSHFDIHVPLTSYHTHNMQERGPELLHKIQSGETLALVTDAGTPGISDPGTLLIHQALEADLPVTVIPGPTALITALVASGLPSHPFAFLGFPPARGTGRKRFFSTYATLPMTVVLYESPQRLLRTLEEIEALWGDRTIAVARELTKQHEEFFRGTVSQARAFYSSGTRGELTLVLAGAEAESGKESGEKPWQEALADLLEEGQSVKAAADQIARRYDIARRTAYQEALKSKQGQNEV